jgi:periplasmic divalent cation tolerance protein
MYSIVYITTGSKTEAETIARTIVEERLAACANIHPITSIYTWKEQIENEEEYAVTFKTTTQAIEPLKKRIKELHSYELPCIIHWNISGTQEYLSWIGENTNVRKG